MAERVEIEVGANTAAAVSGLASVGAASVGMANTAIQAVQSALNPFESFALIISGVEAAVALAERAFRALAEPIGAALDLAIEYRGENDRLVQSLEGVDRQIERIGAAFGEIALQGLEATGVVEDLESFLEDLVDEILDADSAIGQLVRQGFVAFVDVAGFVGQGILRLVEGFTALVGMVNVARETLVEWGLQAERIFATGRLAEITQAQAELTSAPGAFGLGADMAARLEAESAARASALLEEERLLTAQIAAIDEVITRQQQSTQAAREQASTSIEGVRAAIAGFTELQATLDRFAAGVGGDATLSDRPPGGDGGGGSGGGRRRFFGPLGLLFETAPGFEAGLREVAERVARIQEAVGGLFGGAGGPPGKTLEPLKDGMDDVVATMVGSFQGGLDNMLKGLGRFLAAGGSGFERFGEMVRDTFASTLGNIGSAMQQAAVAGLLSGSSGPFGLFAALGGMFALASGLISGAGRAGRGGGGTGASFADTLNTMRPEVSAGGPTTVVQMSIGAVFTPEESTTAVAKLVRRGIDTGELAGMGLGR